jgi:hypothetical protein
MNRIPIMILLNQFLLIMKMGIKKSKKIKKNTTSTDVWVRIQKRINFAVLKRVVLSVR